ncbi:uncharacterized protein LOC111269327 [Varroa jacobsoni]|uniref:C2H2-type domain-containing protein n=1 Tax=Varroa destructor TaxID=109461 RepID=A0A7M7JWC3_VARDE|nr:uncharacterized protein LOC111248991 [Varroa destructor]XP_022704561.1 uncharacterized protein LOC111269327 [Varroa jacobsoni]
MADRTTVQVIGRKVRLVHPPPALSQQPPKTKVVLVQRSTETVNTLAPPAARVRRVTPRSQTSSAQPQQQQQSNASNIISVKYEAVHTPSTTETLLIDNSGDNTAVTTVLPPTSTCSRLTPATTTATAILEIPSLGDELLNGSDTSSKEVVINGRTYSMIESAGGQQMFVDVITQQKLVPVERAGELTLVNVLEDDTDDSELTREIEPEEFMELDGSVTTHVDVIRPPSSAPLEGVVGVSPLVCPPSPVLPVTHVSGSGSTTNESHSSLVNKNTTASGGAQGTFVVCELCKATFSKRSNFYRHLRRAHEADSNLFRAKPQGVKGKCPECDSRFFSRHELLLHLAHNHDLEVVLFNITFTNKEAYARWLEDIKVHYTTSYVAHNGGRKSQDGRTGRIYHCSHEFMSYKMRQAETVDRNELTMRSRRSVANKVPYCTAHLRVFTDEKGVMYVSGSPTHINHDIDPDNLSGARLNLPSSETLPGYRSIFKNCQDGLPAQTKSTITSVVNRAEELKLYMQHRPVSESVLVAIQRCLHGIQRSVSSYKCRAVVSDAILEDQSAQAAVKWAVK